MRDPNRIPEIIGAINELWKRNPDQRFGQLLINNGIVNDDIRLWTNEDSVLLKHLYLILKQ